MGKLEIYAGRIYTGSLPDIIKKTIDEGIIFNYLIFDQ